MMPNPGSSSSSSSVPVSFRPSPLPQADAVSSEGRSQDRETGKRNPSLSRSRVESLKQDSWLIKEPEVVIETPSQQQDLVLSYMICACFDRRSLQ
mmetsp:Transcript_96587/g.171736  ORF Transcript_96587/g.171736 Transcript_96587/m.171736 type:complete len:95 (+) Transcript_96587:74-358(+)